jgi:hypothetical protein
MQGYRFLTENKGPLSKGKGSRKFESKNVECSTGCTKVYIIYTKNKPCATARVDESHMRAANHFLKWWVFN